MRPATTTPAPPTARPSSRFITLGPVRARVTRSFTFEAAHQLPWHQGRCRQLHGHHYRLEVTVEGPVGPDGIVVDFDELAEGFGGLVRERYDHSYLNDLVDNPTAEIIATDVWKQLEAVPVETGSIRVVSLRLWETPDSSVELLAD